MKIVFVCSSLQLGKDGVGDYTRRLAGELIRQGHRVCIVALHDKHIENIQQEVQIDQDSEIDTLRLPSCIFWNKRIEIAKEYVDEFNPEWLSLQYVPFGFHDKGLPFFLGKRLAKLDKNKKWHIMFHEMWIGMSNNSPLRHKVYGKLQKFIAHKIIENLFPTLVNTTNQLYHLLLTKNNINNSVLPLFSNISLFERDIYFLRKIEEEYLNNNENLSDYKVLGFFGTFYPNSGVDKVLKKEIEEVGEDKRKVLVLHFGRMGGLSEFKELYSKFQHTTKFIILGELSEEKVSTLLQSIDKLISCTPEYHKGKSGVYAAARFHNVPVLFAPLDSELVDYWTEIKSYNDYLTVRPSHKWDARYVADLFIKSISQKSNG